MHEIASHSSANAKRPVAVIMSVYHGDDSAQLREALESILNQNIEDSYQIRIYLGVDGPVSEQVQAILSEFESCIYKLIFYAENRGLASVLNDLINVLEEEDLVFRMDSDDVSHTERFSKQIKFLQKNPNVDILGTSIIEQQPNGKSRVVSFPSDHESSMKHMCWRTPIAHPTACIRRSVFRTLKGYPTDSLNEDIALWFQAAYAGFRFANIKTPLLYFRISSNFWNRRGFRKAVAELKCYIVGIYRIYGISYRLIFPCIRFIFRLSPNLILKFGYNLRSFIHIS